MALYMGTSPVPGTESSNMSQDSMESVMARLDPFLDDFDAIPRQAMEFYRGYVRLLRGKPVNDVLLEHSKRTAANCIYDHMVAECERRFFARPDIKLLEIRGLKLWLIGRDEHAVIRWKKMDEDGRSRNYPTKQAKDFDLQLPLTGLPETPTRITVGYWPDPAGVSVVRAQVARPNGKLVDWCAAIVPPSERAEGAKNGRM